MYRGRGDLSGRKLRLLRCVFVDLAIMEELVELSRLPK